MMSITITEHLWKSHFIAIFCLFWKEMLIFEAKSQYIGIMKQQEIGKAIKERRKELGINQQTLADLASIAVNTVVAIERG